MKKQLNRSALIALTIFVSGNTLLVNCLAKTSCNFFNGLLLSIAIVFLEVASVLFISRTKLKKHTVLRNIYSCLGTVLFIIWAFLTFVAATAIFIIITVGCIVVGFILMCHASLDDEITTHQDDEAAIDE